MGNRAIVTTQTEWCRDGIGVYLHWNGGYDSVNAFCKYLKFKAARTDDSYFLARFTQVVCNFFGGTLSCGIVPARCGAGDDNGVYIINDYKIVRRFFSPGEEQNNYDLWEMLQAINDRQPEPIQEDLLHRMYMMDQFPISYAEKLELLKVGHELYVRDWNGEFFTCKVIGFGAPGQVVNGYDVSGVPYVNKYNPLDADQMKRNINNYILENTEFYWR